jgi:hypothetical protein
VWGCIAPSRHASWVPRPSVGRRKDRPSRAVFLPLLNPYPARRLLRRTRSVPRAGVRETGVGSGGGDNQCLLRHLLPIALF